MERLRMSVVWCVWGMDVGLWLGLGCGCVEMVMRYFTQGGLGMSSGGLGGFWGVGWLGEG